MEHDPIADPTGTIQNVEGRRSLDDMIEDAITAEVEPQPELDPIDDEIELARAMAQLSSGTLTVTTGVSKPQAPASLAQAKAAVDAAQRNLMAAQGDYIAALEALVG
jgi:hypothetical protein